ncbi:MAG: hypothetical protein ACPKPY_06210 [Nitrososphaeraceae archaeon]
MEKIKEYLLRQKEFRDLYELKPILEVSETMNLDKKWSIAATILSALEGHIKKWLESKAGYKNKDLKNKNFDELISYVENYLDNNNIQYSDMELSKMKGMRHYRNKIFHEMKVPPNKELEDIKKECIKSIEYINSLQN